MAEIDREKVFDAFRNCITEPKCKDCPWETCEEFHQAKNIPLDLCLDILKLLKEQEAVEPYSMNAERTYGICPKCGKFVFRYSNVEENHYCGICGQAVKWE